MRGRPLAHPTGVIDGRVSTECEDRPLAFDFGLLSARVGALDLP